MFVACKMTKLSFSKLALLQIYLIASAAVVFGLCPTHHYPAPALSSCVPCDSMFQWQIMGEGASAAIVTALVRLDNSTKHVQCVTTNGLDCQWSRQEAPGSIMNSASTATLMPLGCDRINSIYFPLEVYSGSHWCNRIWMFLHKFCGNNVTSLSPSIVRAKALTVLNVSTQASFGASRECGGAIAGGHALPGSTHPHPQYQTGFQS